MPDDEEKGDEAISLLVETSWAEMDHESAVEVRDQLYGLEIQRIQPYRLIWPRRTWRKIIRMRTRLTLVTQTL